MPLEFPYDLLKYRSYRLDIFGSVFGGGMSNNGQQQVVNASGGGLWVLDMNFGSLRTPDQIRSWRAIRHGQQGGVVPVNISICEIRQAPRGAGGSSYSSVPHSDGTSFSDGSLYAGSVVSAVTVSEISQHSTQVVIFVDGDAAILGGEYFSLEYGEGRHELHVITYSEPVEGGYLVKFEPPSRASHLAGADVEFAHPKCTMRLAESSGMSGDMLINRRIDNPSATFIEYFAA